MAKVIVMPKLGYTQDNGQIVEWHKKVGDYVEKGEPFFDVHTDKSVITVEATTVGTLLKILLEEGIEVPVLTPVAVVGEEGEDAEAELAKHVTATAGDGGDDSEGKIAAEKSTPPDTSDKNREDLHRLKLTPRARKYMREHNMEIGSMSGIQGSGFEGGITEGDIKASPLAKKYAEKHEVDLSKVTGSGAGGKIMKADVETAASNQGQGTEKEPEVLKVLPYAGVRKVIGERLSQSKFTAPHLYFTDSIDTTNFTAFRKQLSETNGSKITVSDLLIVAASKCLQKYPEINASLIDDSIICYKSTNIGMAVAGDNGLVVPVIKNVQNKTITQVAGETRELVERAKAGSLLPEEYCGGTFTISNLGMFGIGNFTAIINPPESAILSISSVRKIPVAVKGEDGSDIIAIRPMMNVQLSVDHRIIDGLAAARFVEYFKELIESPLKILM